MFKKIKSILLTLATASLMFAPALVAVPAYADSNVDSNQITGALCAGSNFFVDTHTQSGTGQCQSGGTTTSINTLLANIVTIFSAVVGVIAVIMIIVGGLRYITSGGDSSKVSAAKTTILYAIIGLVVVALAQIIVHFVLNQASNIINPGA